MKTEKIIVLLVEDNPADADLMQEHLEQTTIDLDLNIVKDGVEAMDFLYRKGRYKNSPRPDLILLDLNIPRKNGLDVLEAIKSDGDIRRIPIVVLTSSHTEKYIINSYELNASAYVTKPVDLAGFTTLVKSIEEFWFNLVSFPPGR